MKTLIATAVMLALAFPDTVTAAPRKTTQQILQDARTAPGARTVIAGALGKSQQKLGTFDVVGKAPDGFGQVFNWNRSVRELSLVVFVNPADPGGVAITNLKSGDVLRIESATGEATFAEGKGALIGGLIGLIGEAVKIPLPEAKGFIDEGTKFAKEHFGKPNRAKTRDAFGLENSYVPDAKRIGFPLPMKRAKVLRRCEGGVLITMPPAGGVYDSNPGCIKGKDDVDGRRTNRRRPDHVKHGFFLMPGPSNHTITGDGVVHILAWDRRFDDNQGFYRIIIKLTRKDAVLPLPTVD